MFPNKNPFRGFQIIDWSAESFDDSFQSFPLDLLTSLVRTCEFFYHLAPRFDSRSQDSDIITCLWWILICAINPPEPQDTFTTSTEDVPEQLRGGRKKTIYSDRKSLHASRRQKKGTVHGTFSTKREVKMKKVFCWRKASRGGWGSWSLFQPQQINPKKIPFKCRELEANEPFIVVINSSLQLMSKRRQIEWNFENLIRGLKALERYG